MIKLRDIFKKWRVSQIRAIVFLFLTCIVFSLFLLSHKLLQYPEDYSQLIFSVDGQLLNASLAKDEQWRFYSDTNLSEKLKSAVVTFEDKRFFNHLGVDFIALSRAIFQNISGGRKVSGASTLTMQVVRLGRRGYARSFGEKLLEMIMAFRLETQFSKNEILQKWAMYAPFGSNVVGVEAASWRYFGRSSVDLSWSEAALLAVLPNSPALIFPGRNHYLLLEKRNRLLKKLQRNNTIDSLTCALALDEELPETFYPMPRDLPHLSQHVERLMGARLSNRYVVSIDPALQRKVASIASNYQNQYAHQMIKNIAMIVADTRSGKVLAYVGNAGDLNENGAQVDVIQSIRSTGSLLKPFLYAGALSEGLIAPSELLVDLPVNYAGYSPKNYNDQYSGGVSASEALSRSLNVPMVRLLRQFGVGKFHRRLHEAGVHSLIEGPSHYGLSLILGGADATLFELAGMYAALGRSLLEFPGLSGSYFVDNYHPLHFGNYTMKPDVYSEPPFFAGSIWQTFEAMRRVERPTDEGRWQQFSSSRRLAWKTGTSYGFRDAWAIGLDPMYTVGVWVGNVDGVPQNGLVGVRKAGPVLFETFRLLSDSDVWFPVPWDDMKEIEVCVHSGKIAGEYCIHKETRWLPALASRSGVCEWCMPVIVSPDLSERYYRQCVSGRVIDTSWFVLPPGMEWYYSRQHSRYRYLPQLSNSCSAFNPSINPIDFVYPHAGSRLVLPVDVSGQTNEVVFQAVHRNPNSTLFWYLDDEYLLQTEKYHKIGIVPEVGWHTLFVEDLKGNRKHLKFKILDKKESSSSIR